MKRINPYIYMLTWHNYIKRQRNELGTNTVETHFQTKLKQPKVRPCNSYSYSQREITERYIGRQRCHQRKTMNILQAWSKQHLGNYSSCSLSKAVRKSTLQRKSSGERLSEKAEKTARERPVKGQLDGCCRKKLYFSKCELVSAKYQCQSQT